MKNPIDSDITPEQKKLFENLIGVSDSSPRKTYYPELQKKIEQLEKEKQKYKDIIELAPNGIFQLKKDSGEVILVNQSTVLMFGFKTKKEFIEHFEKNDKNLFLTKFDFDSFIKKLFKYGNVERYETTLKGNNKEVIVLLDGRILDNGEYEYIEMFAQDITEQKKLENQLLKSQKLEAIGTLSAGIAHDFNNILSIIMGNVDLIIDTKNNSEIGDVLHEIKIASIRAKDIIKQLLSLGRKQKVDNKIIDLTQIVKESIKLLRSSIPSTIEIRYQIQKDIGNIKADKSQIHQILINLGMNGYHAMEKNNRGVLDINLKNISLSEYEAKNYFNLPKGDYAQIVVSDTGDGISPNIINKIFDPYFTTKEVGKGTGMGLAVVHGIVIQNKGAISVYSEENKGTSFKILFPIVSKDKKENLDIKYNFKKGKGKIVIVDDERQILKINEKILIKLGYKVVPFYKPIEALNYIEKNSDIDILITDMTMPKMTGLELSQKVKKLNKNIKIVLTTGFTNTIDRMKAETYGIDRYIEKPLNIAELSEIVQFLINKKI